MIGKPNHTVKGSTTCLPNAKGRSPPNSTISAAFAAPCVLLSPAGNKIEVTFVPPALPLMDAMPLAAARTKKKRKKATAPAVLAAASDNALTATLTLSTAPATKKGKTTSKKKATKPIDLRATPMWAKMTNGVSHRIVAIAHGQKWVTSNATTINGDVANEPLLGCQWYQKGPSRKRIAPGNQDFADMSAINAFLHRMLPEQLALVLELTNKRLATKGKMELTRQELLWWIGVCILVPSINFWGNHCKLWEGGGRYSKFLPSYNLCATGMLGNRFDNIWYAVRWSC